MMNIQPSSDCPERVFLFKFVHTAGWRKKRPLMNEPSTQPLKIKSWSPDDRPREKLLTKGAPTLSDAELVAILLGTGTRTASAVELARRLLATVDNNLDELARRSVRDLMTLRGIGEAKAISIAAALELGRRR